MVLAAAVATSSPHRSAPNIRVTPEQPDASAMLDGERKTVSALFADIKGSTELMQDLDPEEARAIVDPALKLMIDAVRRYDGYVVQSTGDGIFALFGAPVAHEDHPQLALYAALRMQEELERYSTRLRAGGNLPIEARVGVNTGEVVVRSITTGEGHTEYTPIGHTANLASRMQALAPTGSIAISEQTRRFVEGYFQIKPLGPTKVKGVSEPVNVYQVTGLGPLRTRLQKSERRGLSRFVGRGREIEEMKRALERATDAHGQVVAAMGEAGLGKSRLFYEFKVVAGGGCLVLEAFSVSHGKASAYLPLIELLRNYFEITADDDERKRREKITGKVLALDRSLEETLIYLFVLLGVGDAVDPLAQMDPQIRQRRTMEAVTRLLLRESLNQPLIVIFEDLHWIDAGTQVFLNALVDRLATAHILLLLNYRPEYRHNWSNKSSYAQLRLDPLGRESAEEMIVALVGDEAELQPLRRLIIEKTGSNPFFMEESVQILFDERTLVRNGAIKLTKKLDALRIPPTVQAILAARIDRLPATEKDLLQTLAVIGKEFPLRLIRKITGALDDDLERMLHDLQVGEFIYEQPALPDVEYIFKHSLTQEVAYNSVLNERRKPLHERTAQALESLFSDQLDDHLPDLARHYSRSGNTSKAIHYLRIAGEQAARRCAHEEAAGLFNSALEMLAGVPEGQERIRREVELRLALIGSLVVSKGYAAPEVDESTRRALELSNELGEPELHFTALMFTWAFHQVRRNLELASETSTKLIELAERTREPGMMVHANFAGGALAVFRGRLRAARARLERAVATDHSPPLYGTPQDPRVASLSFLSLTLWLLGYPTAAAEMNKEAIRRARDLGHPMSLAFALSYGAMLHLCRRDPEAALELADGAHSVAMEHGFPYWSALGSTYHGIAQAALGRIEEGIAETLAGIDSYRATGSALGAAAVMVGLVSSYLKAGLTEEAIRAAEQALSAIEQSGARMSEAELYRLKGEALLGGAAPFEAEAQACFDTAIMVAREQEAKSWELLATMSLARLLASQGRRDDARAMLSEIYNWFAEGFDTADLKDAKALLDQLGA
jgi:class 3 adenylate cyclase/predicted ATPase